MIFGYTLAESKKFVIAGIAFVGSIVALFVAYEPGVNEAAISIAGSLFGLVGVFMAPQFSIEDFSKYLEAFKGACIAMANFWFVVNPSLTVKITTAVGAIIALVAIKYANNEKSHNVAAH
jgi:hypothetical protein